jgi:prevent-host-death family protein
MVDNMTMKKVNIFEVKARLSEYIDAVERGERVLICRRNRPVAELRAVASVRSKPRPIGGAKGRLTVPATFFEPLPLDVTDAFYGDEAGSATRGISRVAEKRATYQVDRPRRRRR